MQIVHNGDYLLEMSNLVIWEKYEKYFKMFSAEKFTQSAKCYMINSATVSETQHQI